MELLVAIALLSVIAMVAFPIVVQHADRAEPVRVAHDLASVRSGMELFHLQTRTAYPRSLNDLITPIDGRNGPDDLPYTASEAAGWGGPYLDAVLATASSNIRTGGDVQIASLFSFFDVDLNCQRTAANRSDAEFLAVRTAAAITWDLFEDVNDIIDGEAEPDGYGEGLSTHLGRFRLTACPEPGNLATPTAVAYYLAIPY